MTKPKARWYQRTATWVTVHNLTRGFSAAIISPTRSGKTRMCLDVVEKRGGRALVITPRIEISKQWAEAAEGYGWTSSVIGGGKFDATGHIVCSTISSAHSKRRDIFSSGPFDTLIIDEAHHTESYSCQSVIETFREANPHGKLLLTTATPGRSDGVDLSKFIDTPVMRVSHETAKASGALMGYRTREVDLPKTFSRSSAATLCDEWERAGGKKIQTVFFADRVAHLPIVVEEMRRRGVTAEALSGVTPVLLRRQILSAYDEGTLQVIVNVGVLTEGVDINQTGIVILASQPKTDTPFIQRTGRALGRSAGKQKPTIIIGRPRGNINLEKVSPIDDEAINNKRLKGIRRSIWNGVRLSEMSTKKQKR